MKKSSKGFTLVELIVVIAIIGILAAILVPALLGYIKDSKLTSANASAKQIYTAVNNYSQKCLTAGYPIVGESKGVAFVDITNAKIEKTESDSAPSPTGPVGEAMIQEAVNCSMGEDARDTVYSVSFNANGFPKAVIWSKSESDPYIGGYPEEATDTDWTLIKAEKAS